MEYTLASLAAHLNGRLIGDGTIRIAGVNNLDAAGPDQLTFAEDERRLAQALKSHVGTKDYTELPLPGGHVGVFVSGKSQGILGKNIYGWLKGHS